MFDRDGSSTIDFEEFRDLWKYVSDWEKCFRFSFFFFVYLLDDINLLNYFRRFDLDGNGTIDKHELKTALSSFGKLFVHQKYSSISLILYFLGYRLSDLFYDLLIRKFDRTGRGTVAFDDFIQACVSIQTLTNAFRQYDRYQNGQITINYEDFLTLVFSLKM